MQSLKTKIVLHLLKSLKKCTKLTLSTHCNVCQEVKIQTETANELLTHICKENWYCSETVNNIVPNKINQVVKESSIKNEINVELVK